MPPNPSSLIQDLGGHTRIIDTLLVDSYDNEPPVPPSVESLPCFGFNPPIQEVAYFLVLNHVV